MLSFFSSQHDGIKVTLTDNPKPIPDHDKLIFGRVFTDHMLTINWSKDDGWCTPHIVPYGYLSISPAAACFHYAVEVSRTCILFNFRISIKYSF